MDQTFLVMSGIFPTSNSRGFYTSNSSFLQFVRKQWKYNEIVEIMRYLISIIEFIIIFKYLRNYYSFCANWWNYDVFLKIYSIYLISTYSKLSFVSKFLVENIFQFSDSAVTRTIRYLRDRSWGHSWNNNRRSGNGQVPPNRSNLLNEESSLLPLLKREETLNPISTVSDTLLSVLRRDEIRDREGYFGNKERDRRKIREDTRGVKQSHWRRRKLSLRGSKKKVPDWGRTSGRCVCFLDEACGGERGGATQDP